MIRFSLKMCMLCCRLENFYFRSLVIVSGYLHNTEIAVDALSIWLVFLTSCSYTLSHLFAFSSNSANSFLDNTYMYSSMSIYAWESMIPLGFLAAVGYVVTGCESLCIKELAKS